jgi:hypothetical protein
MIPMECRGECGEAAAMIAHDFPPQGERRMSTTAARSTPPDVDRTAVVVSAKRPASERHDPELIQRNPAQAEVRRVLKCRCNGAPGPPRGG